MMKFDVLIVGGGLAGGTLALALEPLGLKVAMVEAITDEQRHASPAGDRALALARGSVDIFKQLGIWPSVSKHATPIKTIHVSDKGHFGKTRLSATELGVDSLGHVITARYLEMAVADLCRQRQIEIMCPAKVTGLNTEATAIKVELANHGKSTHCQSRLVVAADGGNSQIRQWVGIGYEVNDYHQKALVANISTEIPHDYVAFERFTETGPLAMLPLQASRCAMIWTHGEKNAGEMLALAPHAFEASLQDTFGWKLGRLKLEGKVKAFPLCLIRAQRLFAERVALVGNAAHQLHPVAGQGFNLGLRDVVALARLLESQNHHGGDPGAFTMLEKYAKARASDHNRTIGFSHGLIDLFVPSTIPVTLGRNLGLMVLDHLPTVKHWFARHAMGMAEDS